MENFSHIMGPTQTITRLVTTMRLISARLSHHCPTLSTLHTIYGPNKAYEFLTRDHPENPFETFFVKTLGWPDPTNLEDKD